MQYFAGVLSVHIWLSSVWFWQHVWYSVVSCSQYRRTHCMAAWTPTPASGLMDSLRTFCASTLCPVDFIYLYIYIYFTKPFVMQSPCLVSLLQRFNNDKWPFVAPSVCCTLIHDQTYTFIIQIYYFPLVFSRCGVTQRPSNL